MSYWVAVLFLIGSLLFCFGGGFDYVRAASATELRDGATDVSGALLELVTPKVPVKKR